MRVLLRDLPAWMGDILEHAVKSTIGLTLVQPVPGARTVRDAVAQESPDVLVTGSRDPSKPFGGFVPLLYEFPTLRIFTIGSGRDTLQVTLIPSEESLGDVMLETLMQMIAGSTPPRRVSADSDGFREVARCRRT